MESRAAREQRGRRREFSVRAVLCVIDECLWAVIKYIGMIVLYVHDLSEETCFNLDDQQLLGSSV